MKDIILGIDPGLDGGIAFVKKRAIEVHSMPVKTIKGNSGNRRRVDSSALHAIILKRASRIRIAAVESVGVMTGKESRSAMFNFGYSAGIIEGILASLDIPVIKIHPNVWKPALGLGREKKDSIALIRLLFPEHKDLFKKIKDDGKAEAGLIAHFAEINL